MRNVEKFKASGLKRANAEADIDIINQYAVGTLTPETVYCFSMVLCNNDIDRDLEVFSDAALDKMAELFQGKPTICDHSWSARDQIARLYRLRAETAEGKTRDGRPLRQLIGCAYMMRNDQTQPTIDAIEGGILKEVSVGVSMGACTCSICGAGMYGYECDNGHKKGREYDGKLCYRVLEDPLDAYELSFVAVPAQPGAGVIKGAKDVKAAFGMLLGADLSGYPAEVKALLSQLQGALMSEAERARRAEIIEANKIYLRKDDPNNGNSV